MHHSIIKEIAPPAVVLPSFDVEKARAFFDFRSGQYVAGEGYIPYQLMAVVVDEASLDTMAYFDFVKAKGSAYFKHVTSLRYEIVGGLVVQTWRSKEKKLHGSEYAAVQARAVMYLQEVARLCNF